jgi:hypothetical protein
MTAADLPRVESVPGQLALPTPDRFAARDRTSPPRDLTRAVDSFGLVWIRVEVGGQLTGANLTPTAAARFLREIADDLDEI